jgi:serine/threonine protein kinase
MPYNATQGADPIFRTCAQLDNILLHGDRRDVRLCDFGCSRVEHRYGGCSSTSGTFEYMAPEIIFETQVRS